MACIEDSFESVMSVDGAIAAALIDSTSGFVLYRSGQFDKDAAGADSTELVRANLDTMKALDVTDAVEDILITMGQRYHIIRPVTRSPELFLHLVLDKARSNLAMARRSTANVEVDMFA